MMKRFSGGSTAGCSLRAGKFMVSGLLALQLAACATDESGQTRTLIDDARVLYISAEGLSPVEQKSLARVQRYANLRVQGATVGAVGGALAGAVAGFFAFDDGDGGGVWGALGGAAAGGAVGGTIGYLAGAYYAKLNAASEDRRNDLNFQLAAARESVEESRRAVRDTREIVKSERRKIRRLNRDYKSGKISQDQFRGQISRLGDKVELVGEELRAAQNNVNTMDGVIKSAERQGRGTRSLNQQRSQMVRQVRALKKERDELLAAVSTIPDEVDPPDVSKVPA